jgi:hypothetical protein
MSDSPRLQADWRSPELAYIPSSTRVLDAVVSLGEAAPADIVRFLGANGFKHTPHSVQCSLQRLRRVGKVQRVGYGRWVVGQFELTPADLFKSGRGSLKTGRAMSSQPT